MAIIGIDAHKRTIVVSDNAYPECVHEGELVRKGSRWITKAPSRGPNGHPLGPNQVLVGHVACLGHGGGGHTTWHCRTCEAVVYGPPLNTHCIKLEGPATVRLSNGRKHA